MSRGSRPLSSSLLAEPPPYRSLEQIELRCDLSAHGLQRGERGTILHVFEAAPAYLVEFVNPVDGSTRAEVELTPAQIRRAA